MKKFIITANTYDGGYGVECTLFGVFDSREEATQWILNNPVVTWDESCIHGTCTNKFEFFKYYDKMAVRNIYEKDACGRMYLVGQRTQSKEEYIQQFISEFDGTPILLDAYCE